MYADQFADQLRIMAVLDANAATDLVLDAFRAVPREHFAGPGPWSYISPLAGFDGPLRTTPDADPKWLYNPVLIVLDEEKGINIGDPFLWSRLLVRADIPKGSRILQVGAGVGYYTAILSHIAGPEGHVTAYEVERELAKRAHVNLADWPNTEIRHGDAVQDLDGQEQFDLIVGFAGVTHIPQEWSLRLAQGGRLLLPLTGDAGWGAVILASKTENGFEAATLGACGFYPCSSARDDRLAKRVTELFDDRSRLSGWSLRFVSYKGDSRLAPVAK